MTALHMEKINDENNYIYNDSMCDDCVPRSKSKREGITQQGVSRRSKSKREGITQQGVSRMCSQKFSMFCAQE